ncbi:S-adenosylmethionine decarboxylase family protein [Candidatus Omnitrophota bacterium]
MGSQKAGVIIAKDKVSLTEAQQLRESSITKRPSSFKDIKQDPPSVTETTKSSLLKTKPQNSSPINKGSSPINSSDSYLDINANKSKLKKNNRRGNRKMKKRVDYGMEVILDLYDCDPKLIRSSKAIKSFTRKMCKLLKMERFGQALVPHFGHDDPKTSGYSMLQFIETSSITGHFSELRNSAYINIFSCRKFSSKKAISFTQKYFKAKKIVARRLTRA